MGNCHGADPDSLGRDMHFVGESTIPTANPQLLNARTLHRIKPSKPPTPNPCPLSTSSGLTSRMQAARLRTEYC